MSGGQDWAAEMIRDGDSPAAVDRDELVRMVADDCRELVARLGQDVWRSPAARLLKRRCQQTVTACALALEAVESQREWEPIAPTLANT